MRFTVAPPLPPAGHPVPHAGGVQVSRRIRLLRGEDMLEVYAALPQGGQCHQGEV